MPHAGLPVTITLVPVGSLDKTLLSVIGEAVARTFGRAWAPAQPLAQPLYAYNAQRRQYLASAILNCLSELHWPATERVLGLVDEDLYVPELNFVFGQALLGGRAAVIALPRLRQGFYGLPDDDRLFRERAIKEAIHELGHTYGLRHCPDRRCVMHFSNSLHDTDEKQATFCVQCRAAVERQSIRPCKGVG